MAKCMREGRQRGKALPWFPVGPALTILKGPFPGVVRKWSSLFLRCNQISGIVTPQWPCNPALLHQGVFQCGLKGLDSKWSISKRRLY